MALRDRDNVLSYYKRLADDEPKIDTQLTSRIRYAVTSLPELSQPTAWLAGSSSPFPLPSS